MEKAAKYEKNLMIIPVYFLFFTTLETNLAQILSLRPHPICFLPISDEIY